MKAGSADPVPPQWPGGGLGGGAGGLGGGGGLEGGASQHPEHIMVLAPLPYPHYPPPSHSPSVTHMGLNSNAPSSKLTHEQNKHSGCLMKHSLFNQMISNVLLLSI